MSEEKKKPDAKLTESLTPQQYDVCWNAATEPPFTGAYWNHHEDGNYVCVCCGESLFDSTTKFDSGTGWPSFFQPKAAKSVQQKTDRSHFMERTEILCGKCGAHLGHVFQDGPPPTGLRYCMNSAALKFEPRNK